MRILFVTIFFTLALAILSGAHFFVYLSWVKFFALGITAKKILAASFILFTSAFIGSSWLSHYSQSMMAKVLYEASSIWLGLFSSLFVVTVIIWPFYLLFNNKLSSLSLSIAFSILATAIVMLTAYGYWNASDIKYQEVGIKINNLPESWKGKKIAQLSDVHLNNIHNEKYLRRIVERLNVEKVDAVFLTGDFFDGMDGRLDLLTEPLKNLEAKMGVYFVTGNHETYMGADKAVFALSKYGVVSLLDQKIVIDGLTIVGIKFPERDGLRRDLVGVINDLKVASPSILLFHEPRQVEEVAATKRVDFMLSGHTHNGQLWPYNYIVRWIYGDYATGIHKVGDMLQYTAIGVGTWGPPIRTTGQPQVPIFILE